MTPLNKKPTNKPVKTKREKINVHIMKILAESGDFTDKELASLAFNMAISDVTSNTLIAPAHARAREKGMKEMFNKLVHFVKGEFFWNENNAYKYHKKFNPND